MATVPATTNAATKKLSCVFCTQRKVRCDKLSPCSNCRRAGIACVATVAKRRRTAHQNGTSSGSSEVALETRLRALEGLLENLQNQLESAKGSPGTSDSASPQSQISSTSTLSQDIGRLVLQGPSDVRGISSGFCSTIAEELSSIKQDAESHVIAVEANDEDDDEYEGGSFTSPLESPGPDGQSLLHSGGFIFGHGGSTGTAHLQELLPMPSQVPYLLDVYVHRVQIFISIPHMPSLRESLQDNSPHTGATAAASQQALLASIYYAAIVSLDEEEVTRSFGSPKPELLRKYRTAFELSLAKADFLSKPDLAIVQALCIYLNVARRYESSRVGWMLIGLAIRIGYYLGLHQDGENSTHLPPFEIEMRRRTWWALLALDLRSSEDQGTALAILPGSFTTKWPSNIDDVDLDPKADTIPRGSEKITNVTLHRIMCEVVGTVHEMISGQKNSIEDHANRLNRLSSLVHQEFFRYHEAKQHSSYMPLTGLIHIVMGRLTIVGYFPIVGSNATNADMNVQLRTKVLVAAVEVTEHNHGLNTDHRCRPWAWVYQCEVYWHAIVYILIEICRRPWTSTIERAWLSLHSPHLIPARAAIQDNFQVFVPLQKLMHRARLHRKRELARWRADPTAATAAEFEDQMTIPVHDCSGTFPGLSNTEDFRQRWLRLTMPSSSTSPESNVLDERHHLSRKDSNDTAVSGQTHWDMGTSTNSSAQSTLEPPKSLPTVLGLPADVSNQQDYDNTDFNMDIDWDEWIGAAQGMDWTL